MDRALLIALLGIPILIVMHIALFWQPIPSGGEAFWTAQDGERFQLRGRWQPPDQTRPTRFVTERASEKGS